MSVIIDDRSVAIAGYKRWTRTIIVGETETQDVINALKSALVACFDEHKADSAVVFAKRAPDDLSAFARAVASRDGRRGWSGNGQLMEADRRDDGRAEIRFLQASQDALHLVSIDRPRRRIGIRTGRR